MSKPTLKQVCQTTALLFVDDVPTVILTVHHDLDAAFDKAQNFFGAPLDCGTWEELSSESPTFVRNAAAQFDNVSFRVFFLKVEPASIN